MLLISLTLPIFQKMSKKKTKTNRFIYLLGTCFISSTMPKSQMPCTNISINFIYFFLLSQDFFELHFSTEYWIQLQKLLDICVCKCSRACVCARSIVCKKRATPGHNFIYNLFCCCCYFCLFFFHFFLFLNLRILLLLQLISPLWNTLGVY